MNNYIGYQLMFPKYKYLDHNIHKTMIQLVNYK